MLSQLDVSQCSHDSRLFQEVNIWPSCRLLGVDKLFSYAINEWLNDIKKNQLPGILGGVGPIHSLVQLGKLLFFTLQPEAIRIHWSCIMYNFSNQHFSSEH